jgi:hypothetical protein
MKTTSSLIAASALALAVIVTSAVPVQAQMRLPMGIPIPTTIVIEKPAVGQTFGDKETVTMGVGAKSYKFILKDGYVDTNGDVRWPTIWQQVRQYRPNFHVTGVGEDVFEKIQPGQTVTVRGMYAPLNQSFEVTSTDAGREGTSPAMHY